MSEKVLPFAKLPAVAVDPTPVTQDTLYQITLAYCRALRNVYAATGRFGSEAEQEMLAAIYALRKVCVLCAPEPGTTGDDTHASPQNVG
jgi:hypothetical protein